jgi:hypothetical protein
MYESTSGLQSRRLVNSTEFELLSRLIAISFDGTNYKVRLVETEGWSAEEIGPLSYAALSHCWGPKPDEISQTTKENLAASKENIDFSTLSRTFQEAIKVAQALRTNYLWIDSLCIVQNDAEDWG